MSLATIATLLLLLLTARVLPLATASSCSGSANTTIGHIMTLATGMILARAGPCFFGDFQDRGCRGLHVQHGNLYLPEEILHSRGSSPCINWNPDLLFGHSFPL